MRYLYNGLSTGSLVRFRAGNSWTFEHSLFCDSYTHSFDSLCFCSFRCLCRYAPFGLVTFVLTAYIELRHWCVCMVFDVRQWSGGSIFVNAWRRTSVNWGKGPFLDLYFERTFSFPRSSHYATSHDEMQPEVLEVTLAASFLSSASQTTSATS